MVCNEEEDPKSPFNGWLKAYNIAIDFGEQIRQNQGPKTRNWNIQLTGEGRDSARQKAPRAALEEPRKGGYNHVFAVVRARRRPYFGPGVVPLAPFPLVPVNTPWGSSSGRDTESSVVSYYVIA